jgi:hypothetical protein
MAEEANRPRDYPQRLQMIAGEAGLLRALFAPRDVRSQKASGLFVFNHFCRLILAISVLPCYDLDVDDVDSRAEDHVGDEAGTRWLAREYVVVATQI